MIKKLAELILSLRTRFIYVIDKSKYELQSITKFFDRIGKPEISSIPYIRNIDTPSSINYNKFLTAVENDITLIRSIQEKMRNGILSGWNIVESISEKSMIVESLYDKDFMLEHNRASLVGNYITLAVDNFTNVIPKIKDKPILNAECSDKSIPVYYGKAFGAYIKGNESGEDGIRYENRDTSVIIDEKDTFWETEVVVLQESRDNTKFLQSVTGKDVSLKVTCKIIFNEPISINTFSIIPYNAAVSAYYRLDKCEVSDGIKIIPLNIKESLIIGETQFMFDIPKELENQKIRSIFITLKQNNGYFMKYSLAYFKLQNTETWIDITGSHVVDMAKKMGNDFDGNVNKVIEDANSWILNYWLPCISYTTKPKLITTEGTEGYYLVPSSESERKRYTIGITDLKIGLNEYSDISEMVTNEIDIQGGYNSFSLQVNAQGDIYYSLSFDNGMTWNRIVPLGSEPIYDTDLHIIPDTIYSNSDLALKRKLNTDTGENAFVTTASKKLRIRFVLNYNSDTKILPTIFSWQLKQGVS